MCTGCRVLIWILLSSLILAGGALEIPLGPRLFLMTAVAFFRTAAPLADLLTTCHQLLLARCLQGVVRLCGGPGSLAIISASFDRFARAGRSCPGRLHRQITALRSSPLGGGSDYASCRWAFFSESPGGVGHPRLYFLFLFLKVALRTRNADWSVSASRPEGSGG